MNLVVIFFIDGVGGVGVIFFPFFFFWDSDLNPDHQDDSLAQWPLLNCNPLRLRFRAKMPVQDNTNDVICQDRHSKFPDKSSKFHNKVKRVFQSFRSYPLCLQTVHCYVQCPALAQHSQFCCLFLFCIWFTH